MALSALRYNFNTKKAFSLRSSQASICRGNNLFLHLNLIIILTRNKPSSKVANCNFVMAIGLLVRDFENNICNVSGAGNTVHGSLIISDFSLLCVSNAPPRIPAWESYWLHLFGFSPVQMQWWWGNCASAMHWLLISVAELVWKYWIIALYHIHSTVLYVLYFTVYAVCIIHTVFHCIICTVMW